MEEGGKGREVTHRRVHVSRRVAVGVGQHGDDADHDGLHRVDGQPALLRLLVAKLVLARLVEDGDAHVSVLGHWEEEEPDLKHGFCSHVVRTASGSPQRWRGRTEPHLHRPLWRPLSPSSTYREQRANNVSSGQQEEVQLQIFLPFGCQISVMNFIFGGRRG